MPCLDLYQQLSNQHSEILSTTRHDSSEFQYRMHELEDALFKALQQCKQDPLLFSVMVENQVALGNLQLAHLYAVRAHRQRPQLWQTNHALGSTLCMQKDYQQGIPLLEQAVELAPGRPGLVFNLCSTYVSAQRFRQAIDACSNLLNMEQHALSGPAYLLRSQAYQALGETGKASADSNSAEALGFELQVQAQDESP